MSELREALELSMAELSEDTGDGEQLEANADQVDMSGEETERNNSPESNTSQETIEPDTDGNVEQSAQPEGAQENSTSEQANVADASEKAPAGWTPANREHWGKLAPELKQQISKREREVNDVLQNSADSRKFKDGFDKVVGNYAHVMRSEGVNDPMQALNGLFETASTLTSGNPQVKAERIAHLIKHYNIDVGTLDDVLSGQVSAQAPQDDPMARMLDERLKPMQDMFNNMQSQQTNQAAQQQTNITNEVQEFENKSEFIKDVRHDMADLMTMAANRGQAMSMQDAYDKACMLNPEISGVLAQRKQQDDIGLKRKAAVSLNGKIGGNEQQDVGGASLRDTIESAWGGEFA